MGTPTTPTTPTASTTPATQPAAISTPATTTPTTPSTPAASSEGDPFAAMDAKTRRLPSEVKTKEGKPGEKPDGKPTDKPAEAGSKTTPTDDNKSNRTIEPKALRSQLEKVNGELREMREAKTALEARIKEFDSKGKDTTVLAEQLANLQKEHETTLSELRALKQEASPEFKEKWDKPFNQTAEYARREVEQLLVTSADGNSRQAQWNDFVALYQMPTGAAIAKAKELFGEAAPIVTQHLAELHRLDFQRKNALEEEKAKWKETETAQAARATQQQEAFKAAHIKVVKDLTAKNAEWFAEDPNDPEGNELLQESQALLDYKPRSFQEAVLLHARHQLQAAAFPRMARRAQQLQAKVTELEGVIAELRGSAPGATNRQGGSDKLAAKGWKEELKEAMQ